MIVYQGYLVLPKIKEDLEIITQIYDDSINFLTDCPEFAANVISGICKCLHITVKYPLTMNR